MADRDRSIPEICRELDDLPTSTLYHYLNADGKTSVILVRRHTPFVDQLGELARPGA